MKKRFFSIILSLGLLLSVAVPALAAAEPEPTPEPEYRLVKVVQMIDGAAEYVHSFAYGQGGYLPTEVTYVNDPSYPVTITYDEAGRVISYQNQAGTANSWLYDDEGDLAEHSSAFSVLSFTYEQHIKYTYDEAGNKLTETSEVDRSDGGTYSGQTEYTYDEDGNLLRETLEEDAYGESRSSHTEYTYDDAGNRTGYTKTSTDAAGSETTEECAYTYTFDEEGRIATETSTKNGEADDTTTYAYDEEGQLIEEAHDSGDVTRYYPSPLFEAEWVTAPSIEYSNFSLEFLDTAGNSAYRLDFTIDDPTATYDDNGYLIKVDDGAGETIELTYEPVA